MRDIFVMAEKVWKELDRMEISPHFHAKKWGVDSVPELVGKTARYWAKDIRDATVVIVGVESHHTKAGGEQWKAYVFPDIDGRKSLPVVLLEPLQ